LTPSARFSAALTSGLIPAIVAFVVLMVIDGDLNASLVTAIIVWLGMTAVMWVRFGRRNTPGRR
jgi:hypothetical protein